MIPYVIAAAALLMVVLGLHSLEEVRRGARYRRFGAISQIAAGLFFVVMGLALPRFPSVLRLGWLLAAIVVALAAWQVAMTIRRQRARRSSELQRFSDRVP